MLKAKEGIFYHLFQQFESITAHTQQIFSSRSCSAAGSNLRMVSPNLISVVKVLIIRARSVQQILDLAFFQQSGGALNALQLQTGSTIQFSRQVLKFSHTERKSYACALTYVPCRILLQQFSLGTRPQKVKCMIMSQLQLRRNNLSLTAYVQL